MLIVESFVLYPFSFMWFIIIGLGIAYSIQRDTDPPV